MADSSTFNPEEALRALAAAWPGGQRALANYIRERETGAGRQVQAEMAGAIIDPAAFYRPEEASRVTPWSVRTFEAWRAAGKGPAYSKVAGRILYRGSDLLAFLDEARRPGGAERRARQQRRRGVKSGAG